MDYLKQVCRSIAEAGWKSTWNRGLSHLKRKTVTYADLGFDLKYGVETCALRSIHDLDVDDALKSDLRGYEPTPVRVIRAMLHSIPIKHSEYTFIDYGSGKGRVLLIASEFPYKKIIGLELSRSLHDIASHNIKLWKNPAQKCRELVSFNMDAVEFQLPEDPLVLFFFTPFLEPVLAKVVKTIKSHIRQGTSAVYIMYYGSRQELIEQFRHLGLTYAEVYSKRSFLSTGEYKGHLFFRKN